MHGATVNIYIICIKFSVIKMQIMWCLLHAVVDQAHSLSTLLTSEVTQNNSLTPGCLLRNRGRIGTKLQIRNANCLLLVTSIAMDKISNVAMWCINDHFSSGCQLCDINWHIQ